MAKQGEEYDEVPIGCVVVKDGEIIAEAHNRKEENKSALCHAEMLALAEAAGKIGDWRLYGCDVYVTLEPCAMCAGAMINSRVDNVFSARTTKRPVAAARFTTCPSTNDSIIARTLRAEFWKRNAQGF